jgi:alpha-beta hydrolase superfamily lysophospholipase
VVAWLKDKYETEELYAYATSFGGDLVLKYLAESGNPFRKVSLRCPAVNMYEVLTQTIMDTDALDKLRRGREVPVGFDRKIPVNPQFLEELREKDIRAWDYLDYAEDILVLHGTADEIVPIGAAEAFCENQLIEFVSVDGADHRFRNPQKMDQAIKAILEFFFRNA